MFSSCVAPSRDRNLRLQGEPQRPRTTCNHIDMASIMEGHGNCGSLHVEWDKGGDGRQTRTKGENINKLKVPSFRSITTRLLISCCTGSGRQAKGHKYGTDQPSNREQVLRSRREMVTTSRCDYIDPSVRRGCPGFEPEKGRTHRYEDYLWVASRAANSNARVA